MTNELKNKIKTILVATDFSENADFAIKKAVELAKRGKSNLIICHVIQHKLLDKFLEEFIPENILVKPEEYAETILEEKVRSLSSHKLNIKYIIISKGSPGVKILFCAKKNNVDLIVIGGHGKFAIRNSFVGTTAEYIAKKSNYPVLIIKNQQLKSYKKILLPVDFSKLSNKVIKYVAQFFPHIKTHLIHIGDYEYYDILQNEENERVIPRSKVVKMRKAILFYFQEEMKKFLKKHSKNLGKHTSSITLGYPGPEIIKAAVTTNSDLIIMGTKSHAQLHYQLIGSVTNRVLTEATTDILLIPPTISE